MWETVVWIDCTISALGALCFVVRSLHRKTPLRQCVVVISFDALRSSKRSLDTERCERGKNGLRNCVVDLYGAGVEAVHAAAIGEGFAGAVITW